MSLLTARYSILCTRRLQPPHDDCTFRVQWSNVKFKTTENRFGWPETYTPLTVLPTKSDSEVVFCLQLLKLHSL